MNHLNLFEEFNFSFTYNSKKENLDKELDILVKEYDKNYASYKELPNWKNVLGLVSNLSDMSKILVKYHKLIKKEDIEDFEKISKAIRLDTFRQTRKGIALADELTILLRRKVTEGWPKWLHVGYDPREDLTASINRVYYYGHKHFEEDEKWMNVGDGYVRVR